MSTHSKRYVSKAMHLMVHIRPAVNAYVTDDQGHVREREVEAELSCEFESLMLRSSDENANYDRAFATKRFFPRAAWRALDSRHESHAILGAMPSMSPQAMYEPAPNGGQKLVGMTDAYDPTLHFGVFYLDWIPDEKRRAEAEAALDAHGLNGVEYVEVVPEALPLPWPSYLEMREGAGADKAVASAVRTMGIDPLIVVQYERAQAKPKAGILARMDELQAEQRESEIDESTLERAL